MALSARYRPRGIFHAVVVDGILLYRVCSCNAVFLPIFTRDQEYRFGFSRGNAAQKLLSIERLILYDDLCSNKLRSSGLSTVRVKGWVAVFLSFIGWARGGVVGTVMLGGSIGSWKVARYSTFIAANIAANERIPQTRSCWTISEITILSSVPGYPASVHVCVTHALCV